VLAPADVDAAATVAAALAGLSERGGDSRSAVRTASRIPAEAATSSDALRLADERLYAAKQSGRRSPGRQSADVLQQVLHERSPSLAEHLADVASTAVAVAELLGLDGTEIEHIRQAAQLHDVGKIAVPDAILEKPGPLDDDEWGFVRSHTLMGQRIVCAAPSLSAVGRLIRSSHERWDGTGYPDRLAGDAIPSARGSSASATRTTRCGRIGRTARRRPTRAPLRSCSAAPARSSTSVSSTPSSPSHAGGIHGPCALLRPEPRRRVV
jgi:HD domain-containing protein